MPLEASPGSHRAAQPEWEGGRWIPEFLELTIFIAIGAGSSLCMVWPWVGVDSQAPCRMRSPQAPWSLSHSQIKSGFGKGSHFCCLISIPVAVFVLLHSFRSPTQPRLVWEGSGDGKNGPLKKKMEDF